MGGSLNRGTPKSSILQTFNYKLSILGTSIYGNLRLFKQQKWEYGPKKSHDVNLLDTLAQSAHNQRQAAVSFELQCDLWSWWHPTLVLKQAEIRNKMLAETCPNRETKTQRNRRNKTNKLTVDFKFRDKNPRGCPCASWTSQPKHLSSLGFAIQWYYFF